jgi:hypothetical protein
MADHSGEDFVAIFAPIPNGKVMAALCQLNGFKGRVLETAAGTLAVLSDAKEGTGAKAGEVVSVYAKDMQVMILDRRGGQLAVDLYFAGHHTKSLPPGLALADAPGVLLSLASGGQTMDDLAATHPDKVFEAGGSKWSAFWTLQKLGREGRKELAKRQSSGQA